MAERLRNLVLVLGDQLDMASSAFDGFEPAHDAVWMAEVREEATHVPSAKSRTLMFLAAMRHFAEALREVGRPLHYLALDAPGNPGTLAGALRLAITTLRPEGLVLTAPGDWRVLQALRAVARDTGLPLSLRDDRHFYCTVRDFAAHAEGRSQLRLEYFYREQRRRHGVLMDGTQPVGGQWNFDHDNREAFGKAGPAAVPAPPSFVPDAITQGARRAIEAVLPDSPGSFDAFAYPVTRAQAREALAQFVAHRLPAFGRWQDALWPGEPWLWHSQLSAALNLKLLDPRDVVDAAAAAYRDGQAPIESVEGFIRQILGWREYVRGIYWTRMPSYLEGNALDATQPLPALYWHGETSMRCLADAVSQTLAHGYAHHIQRLMVTGLFALLLGVAPREIHAWYLAVYVDAVEWVELPNTLGMSQAADGGYMASKPYIASGKYIERMSAGSYCAGCRYRPAERVGERACPYTTLYWDFLLRHEARLTANPRTRMQVKNLQRLDDAERAAIAAQAAAVRASLA